MPSPPWNMPPVAAAATECRLSGHGGGIKRDVVPSKTHKCHVRLHGDLAVSYRLRAVGAPPRPARLLHEEAPRRFDKLFELFHPDAFFRSYVACRDAIHQMLAQTPLVGEFDLAADNWDGFMPHDLAMVLVHAARRDADEHGGVALPYNVAMNLIIRATVVYSEPKALLLACDRRVAVNKCLFAARPTDCCVCMEDFTPAERADGSNAIVRLPCSHSFHRDCILPWFCKVATCPKCRHDLAKYLVAATDTPMGKFPGLPTPP